MRNCVKLLLAGFVLGVSAPALADHHKEGASGAAEEAAPLASVVERDETGNATKVSVGGQVYNVCTSDNQDGCINPRAAGLDFGNVPLDQFPDDRGPVDSNAPVIERSTQKKEG